MFIVRRLKIDRHVAALDVAHFAQTLAESSDANRIRFTKPQITDHRHRRLLGMRRERPRRRAANNTEKFPPPHACP